MNVNLLTIGNMFTGMTSPIATSSKTDATKKTSQFSLMDNDNQQQVNVSKTETADNVQLQAQEESVAGQAQDIVDTPQEKIISKTPQTAKASEKSKEQVLSNGAFSKTNTAQPVSTEGTPIEVILPVENSAANAVSDQEGSNIHIQTIVTGQTDKVIPVTIQPQTTAQTTLNVPTQTALNNEEESINLATGQNQKELKSVVPEILKGRLTHNTTQKATVSIDTEQIQKHVVADINKSAVPENGEETIAGKVTTDGKMTITDANLNENISDSSTETKSREASILNNKRLISKYTVDNDTKSTIVAQNKTAATTTNPSPIQLKSSESQVEPVVINPEKSVPAAEKTNIDKTDNPQMLSESLQNKSRETILGGSNSSGDSNVQSLKVADVQISSEQVKGRDNTDVTSGNNSGSDLGQMLQHNNVQVPVTEQSQGVAENMKTAETPTQTLQNDVSIDVGKQILESIQNSASRESGDQQITVRLNPPELGRVYIKFQEQDNQITGLMEVSKTQTRFEVEQALPQIMRNLADSGIQIRRFDVVLNDSGSSEQEAVKDQLLQNGGTQHHDSANSGAHENDPGAMSINEWLLGNNSYQNIYELQEMLTTEGSINVLL
jgi:flagellar hook-length control protein FliK